MLKTLKSPLSGLLALALLLGSAPMSHAVYDTALYDSLLKKIVKESKAGEGGDVRKIIKQALIDHPEEGDDLINALIKKLLKIRGKLAGGEGLEVDDLQIIKKKLHRFLQTHPRHTTGGGNVSPPESNTVPH